MASAKAATARATRDAKVRAAYAARRPRKLRVPLPAYSTRGWRKAIFDASRKAAKEKKVKYVKGEQLDIVVRLYIKNDLKLKKMDVDNLLKHVFDGLQGALAGEGKGEGKKKYEKGRLVRNDRHVYRASVEKLPTPKRFRNHGDDPGSGGSVTIRVRKARAARGRQR